MKNFFTFSFYIFGVICFSFVSCAGQPYIDITREECEVDWTGANVPNSTKPNDVKTGKEPMSLDKVPDALMEIYKGNNGCFGPDADLKKAMDDVKKMLTSQTTTVQLQQILHRLAKAKKCTTALTSFNNFEKKIKALHTSLAKPSEGTAAPIMLANDTIKKLEARIAQLATDTSKSELRQRIQELEEAKTDKDSLLSILGMIGMTLIITTLIFKFMPRFKKEVAPTEDPKKNWISRIFNLFSKRNPSPTVDDSEALNKQISLLNERIKTLETQNTNTIDRKSYESMLKVLDEQKISAKEYEKKHSDLLILYNNLKADSKKQPTTKPTPATVISTDKDIPNADKYYVLYPTAQDSKNEPNKYGFKDENKRSNADGTEAYILYIEAGGKTAKFKFVDDTFVMDDARKSPDIYILSACEEPVKTSFSGAKIKTLTYGTAELQGDYWMITNKATITYEK